jgi:hypothetical protein
VRGGGRILCGFVSLWEALGQTCEQPQQAAWLYTAAHWGSHCWL